VTLSLAIVGLVTLQRLGELAWSHANAARMRAAGGIEVGQGHYWPLIGVHVAWLAGLWLLAWDEPVDLRWLAVYLLLQLGRAWVLWTLGRRWTTRVILLPQMPLIRHGPYRFLRHPNYAVLAAEVAVLPLVFGLWWYALGFTVLNAVLLAARIKAEDRALLAAAQSAAPARNLTGH
jgi:methyltransferase